MVSFALGAAGRFHGNLFEIPSVLFCVDGISAGFCVSGAGAAGAFGVAGAFGAAGAFGPALCILALAHSVVLSDLGLLPVLVLDVADSEKA